MTDVLTAETLRAIVEREADPRPLWHAPAAGTVALLLAALQRYGQHTLDCEIRWTDRGCDCGWTELRTVLTSPHPAEEKP